MWLGDVKPVRTRTLYFSEQPHDPNDPKSKTDFFITVEGQTPKVFDPSDKTPNIIAQQGDVEDWIVENRSQELHAFHIHQLHFLLVEWNGVPVDEPFLRDTINVAYWDGKSKQYPSVKLRMDFRDPNIVGTFVYHCHLLEHEDGGMMGVIRVVPKGSRTDLLGAQKGIVRSTMWAAIRLAPSENQPPNFLQREKCETNLAESRRSGQLLTRVSSGNNNQRVSLAARV